MKHSIAILPRHHSLARSCALALAALASTTTLARAQQCQLSADTQVISLSAGEVQHLSLSAPVFAGQAVQMYGSFHGTFPGTMALGAPIALNVDRYFSGTYFGSSLLLQGNFPGPRTWALLDSQGRATMTVSAPPALYASLVGRTVHHAFGHLDSVNGTWISDCSSNAVRLTFAP